MVNINELEIQIRDYFNNIWRCAVSWQWHNIRNTELLSFKWLDPNFDYSKHVNEIGAGKNSIIPWVSKLKPNDLIFLMDRYHYYGIAIACGSYNFKGPFLKFDEGKVPAIEIKYLHKLDEVTEHTLETHNNPATFTNIDNYNFGLNKVLTYLNLKFPEAIDALQMAIIENKFARICWNKFDWKVPSGFEGKSNTPEYSAVNIHERDFGFALEEWLFDFSKTIEGFHYARIEPVNTESGKHIGKKYNITFFTRNGDIKQWFWVGEISNIEVITPEESKIIVSIYKENGWFNEMILQLEDLKKNNSELIDIDKLKKWDEENLFNIKFNPCDVRLFNLKPFSNNESPPSNHYNLANKKHTINLNINDDEKGLLLNKKDDSTDDNYTIKKKYSERMTEIENIHKKIQTGLLKYLMAQYPSDNIYKEGLKKYYNTRIDLVQIKENGEKIFYEIKTYPSVLYSIRVAIGQLMEYAFYPEQNLAQEFCIVTHLPILEEEKKYINHLKKITGLNLKYIHFNLKNNSI